MNKPGYVPQPGTIPAKVVAHLKAQPPGTEMASRPLMEAIGAEVSGGLNNYLQCAVQGGVLACRPHPDDVRTQLWSLGDGVPLERADDKPARSVPATPGAAPTGKPRKPKKSRALPAEASPRTKAAQQAKRAGLVSVAPLVAAAGADVPLPAVQMPARALRMAVWSTGELVLDIDDEVLSFNQTETQQLAQYLADHSAQIWGGA